MKKIMKSGLSLVLAITIIFSSAIVGFSEIDFGSLFAVKTQAASTSDLTLTLSSDGTYYSVTDCNTSASGNLTIPSTYNGKPVKSIGSEAFYNCANLTSITIPNSVTTIGSYAFYNCSSLSVVYYDGNINQKNNISIGSYNSSLTNSTWYYDKCITFGDHTYTNDCDVTCNVCEQVRTITHTYDNACDTQCNVCSETRTTTHVYDNACDSVCNVCGNTRTVGKHKVRVTGNISVSNATSYPFSLGSNGVYSSTNKANSSSSTFTITALEDCVLKIDYYTSTELNYDYLKIKHNSTNIVSVSGSTSWQTKSIELSEGDKVYITYSKDGSQASGSDTVYFKFAATSFDLVDFDSVESTCDETIYCDICGEIAKNSFNHTYSTDFDNKCNVCGDVRVVEAVTKTYGVFTYCINPDENRGTITITDVNEAATGAVSVPSKIDGYTVTCIGSNAFENCTSITSITIPNSVTSIGEAAFRGCTSLESITLPFVGSSRTASNTYYAVFGYIFGYSSSSYSGTTCQYYSSSSRYYYYIPSSLKTVIITDTTQIPYGAFYNCANLTSITIPNSVTTIGSYAFYYCESLTSITIPDSVTTIGSYAFYYCESLTSITIPDSVTSIDVAAFMGCTSLTLVTIPDSITSIGYYAFSGCESLTSITIPNSVTSIGEAAFRGCTSLESITLPFVGSSRTASNTYYAVFGYIFGYSSSSYSGTTCQYYSSSSRYYYYIPSSLKTVIITDTTQIPYGAFYNCANLTSITIPNSVTTIGSSAFYNCSALSTVYYDGNINQKSNISIGSSNSSLTNATWYCLKCTTSDKHTYSTDFDNKCNVCGDVRVVEAVTKTYGVFTYCINPDENRGTITITDVNEAATGAVSVPSKIDGYTVTCIGSNAFENCTSITSITIPNNVTSIGNAAFKGCTSLESITLPFVGSSRTASNTYGSVFGYIFGYSSSSYSGTTCQYYSSSSRYYYYIPSSLKTVIITDATQIPYGAFYNCSSLSTVYYDGNINQKNNISIGSYNSCLTNAIWHIKCTTSDKHTYSTDFDNKCNVCEYVRVVESVTKTYGVFTYCINPDENRGSITITDVSETATGTVSVPSEIGGYKVVCIGSNAFENCTSITSITIPNTVKSIESYAFYGCSRLTSLTIPDSVEAMGNYMLSGCTGLLELKLPFIDRKFSYLFGENQYEISNDYVPRSLKQITISSGDIGDSSFSGCNNISVITLGDKVTSIGDGAFYACNSITKVTIGNAVKTIGASAFQDCVSLTQVTIGKSVETICTAAFKNCKSLLKVSIPNSTTKIKDSAFENCYNLATLTLGSKVDQIGNYSFRNCWRLTGVAIPDSTTLIGSGAFQDCSSLKKVTFGKNVTTIFDYAFEGCSELENIILPSSATSIGEYAFSNCSSLKRATIRGRTNHINNGTFEGCSSLVTVAFPKNVTTIAYNAFNCCYSLKEVWYEGSKADKNQILVAAGNSYIQDANWYYSSFDTVTHKYSTVCDEECDICGEIRTVNNHESDAGTVTKNATYTATGIKVYKCTVCGEVLETAVIPQLKPATPKLTKVVNTASGAQITWSASEGADNYIVYRRSYNATTKQWSGWSKLKEDVTSTYYLDETVKSGTYYRYTVRATNEGGISGYNTSGLKTYFLSIPKAKTANSNSGVTVKWGKVTGATGYIVYRKTGNGKWQNLGKTTGTTFTDKTAKAGVTYRYTVKAYYGSYVSAYNTNGYAVRRLLTPTLKSVTSAKAGVTFKWNKVTGATGYTIYRKTGNGGWVKLATVTGNSTVSYLDKTAKKGVTYKYTVRAYYGTSTSYYNTKGLSIKDKY